MQWLARFAYVVQTDSSLTKGAAQTAALAVLLMMKSFYALVGVTPAVLPGLEASLVAWRARVALLKASAGPPFAESRLRWVAESSVLLLLLSC
jgi:hypothetical protein